jgi:hypothetical protein
LGLAQHLLEPLDLVLVVCWIADLFDLVLQIVNLLLEKSLVLFDERKLRNHLGCLVFLLVYVEELIDRNLVVAIYF